MSDLASQSPAVLDWAKINAALDAHAASLVATLEIHRQIDSTNRYLLDLARQGARTGSVCLAERQTAGRGRRGRSWVSPCGGNIYLSVLWRFAQGYPAIAGLSLAMGVAVIRALRQQKIDGVALKWPNDIYCAGKKLGGLLIETSGEADGPCAAVVGLGLNVRMPDGDAEDIDQAWTDLGKLTGQTAWDSNRLVAGLLDRILPILADFEERGLNAYLDEWRRYDCLKNRHAALWLGAERLTGIVRGIDDNGLLLLEQPDGQLKAFASGDVSFNGA